MNGYISAHKGEVTSDLRLPRDVVPIRKMSNLLIKYQARKYIKLNYSSTKTIFPFVDMVIFWNKIASVFYENGFNLNIVEIRNSF